MRKREKINKQTNKKTTISHCFSDVIVFLDRLVS